MIRAALVAMVLRLAAPTDGSADGSAAQRAIEAYAEERWEDAIAALEQAYAEDPDPKYIFARAEALRAAGRCEEAIAGFEAFLEAVPDVSDEAKGQADAAIEQCREALEPDGPVVPPPTPPVVDTPLSGAPGPTPPPDPEDRPRPTWRRDGWGHALTWSGVAVAAAGTGLLVEAHRRATRADAASDEKTYGDRLGPAPTLSRVGIPLLAVGGALLTAGIIRFALVARHGGSTRASRRHRGLASRGRTR